MRVFFDENVPRPLRRLLKGHEVSFVEEQGWKGKGNGELLTLVEASFDVMLTSDASLAYQQNFAGRDLSVIVVPSNNLTVLRANALAIVTTLEDLEQIAERVLITIEWNGRRRLQRFDGSKCPAQEADRARH